MLNFPQIAIKPSSLSKMKTIFTQEIFTEQVDILWPSYMSILLTVRSSDKDVYHALYNN